MSNNKDVKRGIVLYIDGKEVTNNVTSIKAEIKKMTNELNGMVIGSKEYVEQTKKIRTLKGILAEHQKNLREVNKEIAKSTISFGRFVDGFNRFGGFIASLVAALTGFILGMRALRDEQNKLEDSQKGLQALTGLDEGAITWLTSRAKELSTTMTKEGLRVRQSANEILDAFMLVGSAKPELLGDKEALAAVTEEAMRLQAAAKDISLNQAVDALTLSLNQYGDASDQVARYANVLAAGSKAGAANIASQAKAIKTAGTAASSANVPIEQTVGLIETLAYKGIKDEVAGTGLKKFFLVLQTGAKDTNPAIVGLDKALENLKNKNMDAGAIKKMFGEEGYNTASVILQNTEMVKQFTEAVTGTNIAYEQSAINSDTMSAKLAQARNQMKLAGIELMEKLTPAITLSTNAMTYVIKILPALIDWFKEWGSTVLWLGGVIVFYSLRASLVSKTMTVLNAVTKTATVLKLAYGVAMNRLHGYTVTAFTDLRNLYTLMKGHPALLKLLRVGTYLYAGGVQLLRGRIDLAGKAMQNAWSIMASNPIGLLVAAVAGAVAISYKLTQQVRDYYNVQKVNEEITKKAAQTYELQNSQIKSLTEQIHNNSLSLTERRNAIEKLKTIIPEYYAVISEEGKITEENTKSLTKYNQQLAINSELHEINEELITRFKNLNFHKNSPAFKDTSLMGAMAREDAREKVEQEEKVINSLRQRRVELYKKLYQLDNPLEKKPLRKKISKVVIGDEPDEERKKRVKKQLEDIETDYMQKMTHLQKLYLEGEIKTNEEYTALQIDLEKKALDEKLKIVGLEPHEREKLQVKMLEAHIKFSKECKVQDEKLGKDRLAIRQRQMRIELEEAASNHFKNFTSEKEYAKEINDIQQRYWQDLLDNYKLTEAQKTQIMQEQATAQADEREKMYNEEVERFNKMKDALIDSTKQLGESMAEFFTGEEKDFADFMKNVLVILLDTLEKQLIATQAAAIAEVTIKDISSKGFLGLATSAAKIALITAAFETAKGILGNFYTGGYTGGGDWDEPKGIVHSDEFVANRFAVANPAVRPVLDLIDHAQRTGSIDNLSSDDLAAVTGKSDSSSVTVVSSPVAVPNGGNDNEVKFLLIECSRLMKQMEERLKEPLLAHTYANGKGGTMEAEELVNKMKRNAQRRK